MAFQAPNAISPLTSSLIAQAGPADQIGKFDAGGSGIVADSNGWQSALITTDNGSALVSGAEGHSLQQDTNATLGDRAYLTRSVNYSSDLAIKYTYKFKLLNTADIRLWCGFAPNGNDMMDNDSANNSWGIQYSTNRADTNFQFISEGTVQTIVDSTVAADTSAHIIEMIYLPGVSVDFKLWNSTHSILQASETITTNIIAAATSINFSCGVTTLTTAIKSIRQFYGVGLLIPQS